MNIPGLEMAYNSAYAAATSSQQLAVDSMQATIALNTATEEQARSALTSAQSLAGQLQSFQTCYDSTNAFKLAAEASGSSDLAIFEQAASAANDQVSAA